MEHTISHKTAPCILISFRSSTSTLHARHPRIPPRTETKRNRRIPPVSTPLYLSFADRGPAHGNLRRLLPWSRFLIFHPFHDRGDTRRSTPFTFLVVHTYLTRTSPYHDPKSTPNLTLHSIPLSLTHIRRLCNITTPIPGSCISTLFRDPSSMSSPH